MTFRIATQDDINTFAHAIRTLTREHEKEGRPLNISQSDFRVGLGTIWWETPSSSVAYYIPPGYKPEPFWWPPPSRRTGQWIYPKEMHINELEDLARLADVVVKYCAAFKLEYVENFFLKWPGWTVDEMGLMTCCGVRQNENAHCISVMLPDERLTEHLSIWIQREEGGWAQITSDALEASIQANVPLHLIISEE